MTGRGSMLGKVARTITVATAILVAPTTPFAAEASTDRTQEPFDDLFAGYESEPGMDFGGRTIASVQSGASRIIGAIARADRRPAFAPLWEFPIALGLLLVQHEIGGHGGRAREFGLGPSYGFGFDFSGFTTLDRDPETNEQIALVAAGGVEADAMVARRILLDLNGPAGADGAKVPLALVTKLDLTVYTAGTSRLGNERRFTRQFEDGNDIAIYLVARQGRRAGADASDVWRRRYEIDFDDPLLKRTHRDVRLTALWNLLDPALGAALWSYFKDHVVHGETTLRTPVFRPGGEIGWMLGTRGALGPQAVSRFLDLHIATPRGVATVYVRDLDSSIDRAWGTGASFRSWRMGPGATLGIEGDLWKEPRAAEELYEGTGWNASAEIDLSFRTRGRFRWGVSAKVGGKSNGYFPGRPLDGGAYAGLGVTAGW